MSAERKLLSDPQAEAINMAMVLRLLYNYVQAKESFNIDGLPDVG